MNCNVNALHKALLISAKQLLAQEMDEMPISSKLDGCYPLSARLIKTDT